MTEAAPALVEHFFRHEYGRLVASLCRRFGFAHLEAVEDAVQSALMDGLESWRGQPLPPNPSAWLYRVAHHHLISALRGASRRRRILEREGGDAARELEEPAPGASFSSEVEDDLLRMLFACCHPALPEPSQTMLALKTLCGFDVREIALRLFTTEANVYKRLARARERLREVSEPWTDLGLEQVAARRSQVMKILYAIFTEGFLSSHAETAIRRELCDEALRLVHVLARHPVGQVPECYALVALMHLHRARFAGRVDPAGDLVLLAEQDRTLWDREEVAMGVEWLGRSATGDRYSRYHAEAAIAAEHGLAPSFEATRWQEIVSSYELLERVSPSPLHRLNRAVAMAEWQGPEQGLRVLEGFVPPTWKRELGSDVLERFALGEPAHR